MEGVVEHSYSNGAETHKEGENYIYESHREVRASFKKLKSWKEESEREFSFISLSIEKGINDLIEEVSALQTQLSVTTKERNDLIETVSILSGEIKTLSTKLPKAPPSATKSLDPHDVDATEEKSMQMR